MSPLRRYRVYGEAPELDKEAVKQFRKDGRKAIRDCVTLQLNKVKSLLRQRKTKYIPAKPGEPPHEHTGVVQKSFKRLGLKIGTFKMSGGVYSDHPGAGRLEFGETDRTGVRTFPHPYLGPAAAAAEPEIDKRLETFLTELGE